MTRPRRPAGPHAGRQGAPRRPDPARGAGRRPDRPREPRPPLSPRRARREALARRRARAALLGSCAFAVVVLSTSLPLHTLLQQRAETAATAATVRHLAAENRSLAAQAKALQNPATVRAIAHSEFMYVEPGQKTYDVVPPSGVAGSSGGLVGVGHVSLDQPVALPGSGASAVALGSTGASQTAGRGRATPRAVAASSGGFVARLLRSLEFWN